MRYLYKVSDWESRAFEQSYAYFGVFSFQNAFGHSDLVYEAASPKTM